ncbi:UbiA family prenyltransferase [Mesonia sp. K7]|uniref:UbiA family prenyltransferase n=1 Tax=Mesonia sp. K7 TaxID=2218606 RepID=UPI000DA8B650|nr:UbiA family prenyltransferase [Mesonia sp. K7]PZD79354.1 prenyltransferase [Mesonia sp. K7]
MNKYLQLIRFRYLILIAATLYAIKFCLFDFLKNNQNFNIDITLNTFGYSILVFSMVCLAASGSVIDFINQKKAIKVNNPEKATLYNTFTEQKAVNLFIGLSILGFLGGFYLSNLIQRPIFSSIFLLISIILYTRGNLLKSYVEVGNILLAVLTSLVFILPGIYDLLPAVNNTNQSWQRELFFILVNYAVFTFFIVWSLLLVHQQKNKNGDYQQENKTLPIILGEKRTNFVIVAILAVVVFATIFYLFTFLYNNSIALFYVLFLVIAPLLFCIFKLLSDKNAYAPVKVLLNLVLVALAGFIALYPVLWK